MLCGPLLGLMITVFAGGLLAFVLLAAPLVLGGLLAVAHGIRTLNEQPEAKNAAGQ